MNRNYFVSNCTAKSVCKIGDYVIKKHFFTNAGISRFKNEVLFLNVFSNYINFPTLIKYNMYTLEINMTYCGCQINYNNIPSNWLNQINDICNNLDTYGIILEDLQQKNILVNNNIIYLIDFDSYYIKRNTKENYNKLFNIFKRLTNN